jgi:hypothetical protein
MKTIQAIRNRIGITKYSYYQVNNENGREYLIQDDFGCFNWYEQKHFNNVGFYKLMKSTDWNLMIASQQEARDNSMLKQIADLRDSMSRMRNSLIALGIKIENIQKKSQSKVDDIKTNLLKKPKLSKRDFHWLSWLQCVNAVEITIKRFHVSDVLYVKNNVLNQWVPADDTKSYLKFIEIDKGYLLDELLEYEVEG